MSDIMFGDRAFKTARSITGTSGPIIYLIEVDAYDFDTQTISTLRYATDGFNAPDAPGYYESRVMRPPDFGRFLLSPGATQVRGPTRSRRAMWCWPITTANSTGCAIGALVV